MAQLVAHHTGSVGVRGSSPLSSTQDKCSAPIGAEHLLYSSQCCVVDPVFFESLLHAAQFCLDVSTAITPGRQCSITSAMRPDHPVHSQHGDRWRNGEP